MKNRLDEWRELSKQIAVSQITTNLANSIGAHDVGFLKHQAKDLGHKSACVAAAILEGIEAANMDGSAFGAPKL